MIKNSILRFILSIAFLVDMASSADVEDTHQQSHKISSNGPNYIYAMEKSEDRAPIDDWEGWMTIEEYACKLQLNDFKTSSITSYVTGSNPNFMIILNDFRTVLKAAEKEKKMRCDGDIRGNEAYIALGILPATSTYYGEFSVRKRRLRETQYVFGWKQDSKGRSYIVSPVVLEELKDCYSVKLDREAVDINNLRKTMSKLTTSDEKDEIYNKYKKVSEKFLKKEKREFVNTIIHRAFEDFIIEYECGQTSIIDITYFSLRTRVYLLTQIINFKRTKQNDNKFWRKEQKTLSPGKSQEPFNYDEWIDLVPTKFRIGQYEYKLQNAATRSKPGGGRLFGLTHTESADKYDQILASLEMKGRPLGLYKDQLIKRQQGYKIHFILKDSNKEAVVHNRFLNGLSLLFDFEVARRLINGDQFSQLPILPVMPYLLDNFDDIKAVKQCFGCLFSDDKEKPNNTRENFIKETILASRKGFNTEKKIRESLRIFHTSAENSDDEYEG